jgi:hypothetical protein
MLTVIDSFVKFLSAELAGSPQVYWQRVSATSEDSHLLKDDALNICVLAVMEKGSEEEVLVSLDLVGSDERTVWQWAKAVRDKLLERQYTPELNYATNPTAPVATGRMVKWDRDDVRFETIISDLHYMHLNATFPICHVREYTP